MLHSVVTYLHRIGPRRILASILGNVLVAVGIAFFKLANLGNDPYTGMNMGLADWLGIAFPLLQLGMNLLLFVVQFFGDRSLIGFGTLVNALLIGSLIDVFYRLLAACFGLPALFVAKLLLLAVGMLICGLGLALYQTADLGVSPYDAAALMLSRRLPRIPYFWCRIFTDSICVMICWLSGGVVGLGTVVTAFCFGPVIALFNPLVAPFFGDKAA